MDVAAEEDEVLVALSHSEHRDVVALQHEASIRQLARLELMCAVGLVEGGVDVGL